MPHKNRAQRRYFQYLVQKGVLPQRKGDEFDEDSSDSMLSEDARPMWKGGEMEENEASGTYLKYRFAQDTTGEPHTQNRKEEIEPMEFMSRGGRVQGRMKPESHYAYGGRIGAFARALKRQRGR